MADVARAIVHVTVTAEETEDALLAVQPLLLLAHVHLDSLRCLDRAQVAAAVNPAHVGDDEALA
eukprot:7069274-Alexandrium_andersonii.AAC.1